MMQDTEILLDLKEEVIKGERNPIILKEHLSEIMENHPGSKIGKRVMATTVSKTTHLSCCLWEFSLHLFKQTSEVSLSLMAV